MQVNGNANTIGGINSGAGNLISGNSSDNAVGLDIRGDSNVVQGNLIGTTATGRASLPNSLGLLIDGDSNTVGGTTSSAGNLIAANLSTGLVIFGDSNVVQSNRIGNAANGNSILSLPNKNSGLVLYGNGNTIGGAGAASNFIGYNSGPGIQIGGGATWWTAIPSRPTVVTASSSLALMATTTSLAP